LESRAYAFLKSGQYALAIADYDAVIRLTTRSPDAFHGRGLAKMAMGDSAGSRADLDAAERLDPKVAETFDMVGLARVDLAGP
jgi:tetratricopeptide (TPR) repeat protein